MGDPTAGSVPTSNQLAAQRTDLAHERSDLAIERTMLAHERTLMAWTRTSTSLISFGFTIYTFFHNVRGQPEHWPVNYITYALVMMITGLVCLLFATLRHRKDVARLEKEYGAEHRGEVEILAILITGLGLLG